MAWIFEISLTLQPSRSFVTLAFASVVAALIPSFTVAEALHPLPRGSICIGPNLMKAPYSENERVKIDLNGQSSDFLAPGQEVFLGWQDINIEEQHVLSVLWQRNVIHSFKLDLKKFKSRGVQIWRSPGYWKLQDICESECRKLVRCDS